MNEYRWKTAKDLLCAMVNNKDYFVRSGTDAKICQRLSSVCTQGYVKMAVKIADELLNELDQKNKTQEDEILSDVREVPEHIRGSEDVKE